MSNNQGWVLAHPSGLLLSSNFAAVQFRYRLSTPQDRFVKVSLRDSSEQGFKEVQVPASTPSTDGWHRVEIPVAKLSKHARPFNRVVFRPTRNVAAPMVVSFEEIRLVRAASAPAAVASAQSRAAAATTTRAAAMKIDCAGSRRPINPMIYGIAANGATSPKEVPWSLKPGANRWGGNGSSRYNWELGSVWNTAADGFWRNMRISTAPTAAPNDSPSASETFLVDNAQRGIPSVVTVPMIGWVARDATSYSFPVSHFGAQQATDPTNPDVGNGRTINGRPLEPGPPQRSSIAAPEDFIGRWVASMRGRVASYVLDHEPDQWSVTHRDVHPRPVTYAEILERTLRYATAIRRSDPGALIAGPAVSDLRAGADWGADRRPGSDEPLIPWYLRSVRAAERRLGLRLLDVLDVHFLPPTASPRATPADGPGREGEMAAAAARIQRTRALWDPSYADDRPLAGIEPPGAVIPQLQRWIAANAPGVTISIGAWDFDGETHISGGLAVAEALGRFGQSGISSAFYRTAPPNDSPAYWGFRTFRNVDGNGLRFLDFSVAAQSAPGTSLFASTDSATGQLVAVALNLEPTTAVEARIATRNCKRIASYTVHVYDGSANGFTATSSLLPDGDVLPVTMKPYSISVLRAVLT